MIEESEASVTDWIAHLKVGDVTAAQPLWERYFERLVRLVQDKLRPRGYVDGEDVALSAFNSFCQAVGRGKFPKLGDRNDMWRLLIYISAKKIARIIEREKAVVHGGLVTHIGDDEVALVVGREPRADLAAEMAEEFRVLIDSLPDDTLRWIAVWKMEGYTNDEIAARLDCSLKTVGNKLKLVRKMLERRGREP